jgi:hypothetical protein
MPTTKTIQRRMENSIRDVLAYDNELVKEVTNISGGTDFLFRNRQTGETFIVSVTKAHSVRVDVTTREGR